MAATSEGRSKRRLGRGLSSLIGDPVSIEPPEKARAADDGSPAAPASNAEQSSHIGDDTAGGLRRIPVDDIHPNPYQPRKDLNDERLAALSASIRSAGVMQPLLVRRRRTGGFELIAGERRWRAARRAGLDAVPAVVHDANDQQAAEWAVVENLQREDLDPVERAEAFRSLIDNFGLTQSQIAERVGLDRSSVSNFLRINSLEPDLKTEIRNGRLSFGHAKALLSIDDPSLRRRLAARTVAEGWSVRALEQKAERTRAHEHGGSTTPTTSGRGAKAAHIIDLEQKISSSIGVPTRIALGRKKSSGRITISFNTLAEFDQILERLGVQDGE